MFYFLEVGYKNFYLKQVFFCFLSNGMTKVKPFREILNQQ